MMLGIVLVPTTPITYNFFFSVMARLYNPLVSIPLWSTLRFVALHVLFG
jgi:hypothetical protein